MRAMVFSLRHRLDAHCFLHDIVTPDATFFALIECLSVNTHVVREAFETVMHATRDVSPATPQDTAHTLHRKLRDVKDFAMFSSVYVSRRRIVVCHAGPHRVHLLSDGVLIASVHEHIAMYDEAFRGNIDPRTYGSVVTRQLGGESPNTAPPEVTKWSTPHSFRVVVCTNDFDNYRDPETYLPHLDKELARGSRSPSGTLLVLDGTRAAWRDFTYREFHDVPRCILFTTAHGRQLFLDSRFDEELDDYPSHYAIYAVPSHVDMSAPWTESFIDAFACLGSVPVTAMRFDATRRKQLDASVVLDVLGG
jgi:hypothetical protein